MDCKVWRSDRWTHCPPRPCKFSQAPGYVSEGFYCGVRWTRTKSLLDTNHRTEDRAGERGFVKWNFQSDIKLSNTRTDHFSLGLFSIEGQVRVEKWSAVKGKLTGKNPLCQMNITHRETDTRAAMTPLSTMGSSVDDGSLDIMEKMEKNPH